MSTWNPYDTVLMVAEIERMGEQAQGPRCEERTRAVRERVDATRWPRSILWGSLALTRRNALLSIARYADLVANPSIMA